MNPVGHQPTGSSDAAAALRGASLAFQNKNLQAPTTPNQKRDNGALTAANASSSAASRSGSPSKRLGPQHTGGSNVTDTEGLVYNSGARLGAGGGNGASGGHLQPRVDSKSPSFIAATLAASRSASPSPMHRTPRRVGSIGSTASGNEAVDSLSIAPTTSLISMFERGKDGDPVKRVSPRRMPTDTSEESLPETWRAPVKLPGIAKTQSIPAKQTMASGDAINDSARPNTRLASISQPPKAVARTFIADVTGSREPKAQQESTRGVDDSPSQKLKPYTKSTPAPVKLSQEGNNTLPASGLSQAKTTKLPEAKAKPAVQPSMKAVPQPIQDSPSTPKRQLTAHQSRDNAQRSQTSPKPVKPKPAPLSTVPRVVSYSTPEVLSPKPTRPSKPALQISRASPVKSVHTSTEPQRTSLQRQRPPTPPKPRGSSNKPTPVVTSTRFVKSASDMGTGEHHKPKAMAMVHQGRDRSDTMSTDDSFVSASSYQSLDRLSPPSLPLRRGSITPSVASAPISPFRGTPRPHNNSSASLGLSNLTNAIMAGSLASARLTPHNTGSSLPPPSLPRRQKSPHLRETMRKPASTEPEEDGRHKPHKHKLSRGKHAHHEGSRKRWRDQITPRERKRYEALWASNRGALLPPTVTSTNAGMTSGGRDRDTTELVVNVVVRELWRRSRLPEDELAEVWDLVDKEKKGWLGRQEFVVGMWLIDQRLKGRKIPRKVSDSVWGSANGVRVMKPKSK